MFFEYAISRPIAATNDDLAYTCYDTNKTDKTSTHVCTDQYKRVNTVASYCGGGFNILV